MLVFYGPQPPATFATLRAGGVCPHCKKGTRFSVYSTIMPVHARAESVTTFIASYACEICFGPIPIQWRIVNWPDATNPIVAEPKMVLPEREPFEFEFVPPEVKRELEEALDCLSVNAFNGFAAVSRRAIQAICTNLGAEATSRVEKQVNEMLELTGNTEEWRTATKQLLLTGHDGAHPHLVPVDGERAATMLALLRDLTHQLYTRPGRVKAAAALRSAAAGKIPG